MSPLKIGFCRLGDIATKNSEIMTQHLFINESKDTPLEIPKNIFDLIEFSTPEMTGKINLTLI